MKSRDIRYVLSVSEKIQLEFVFLQKHRCLPPFWCHIVLYIQPTFILTNEIYKKYKCKSYGACILHVFNLIFI